MAAMNFALVNLFLLLHVSFGQIPDNTSGYVDVRPSAHMFWWLYGSTNPDVPREQLPLVMWLQVGLRNRLKDSLNVVLLHVRRPLRIVLCICLSVENGSVRGRQCSSRLPPVLQW